MHRDSRRGVAAASMSGLKTLRVQRAFSERQGTEDRDREEKEEEQEEEQEEQEEQEQEQEEQEQEQEEQDPHCQPRFAKIRVRCGFDLCVDEA